MPRSYSWVKIPDALLDDPEYMRLRQRLQILLIHLALLCSRQATFEDGALPSLEDMGWLLRCDAEDLQTDLVQLSELGYLQQRDGMWFHSAYLRWQEPAASTLRWRAWRDRQKVGEAASNDQTPYKRRSNTGQTTDLRLKTQDSRPPKRACGPRAPFSPAVAIVREETRLTPPKAAHQDIDSTVQDLDLWRKIVHAWVLAGWNPRNVGGMMECFRAGEIPGTRRNGKPIPEPKGFDAIRQYERLRGGQDGH